MESLINWSLLERKNTNTYCLLQGSMQLVRVIGYRAIISTVEIDTKEFSQSELRSSPTYTTQTSIEYLVEHTYYSKKGSKKIGKPKTVWLPEAKILTDPLQIKEIALGTMIRKFVSGPAYEDPINE